MFGNESFGQVSFGDDFAPTPSQVTGFFAGLGANAIPTGMASFLASSLLRLAPTSSSDIWCGTWGDDDKQWVAWGDGTGFAGGSQVSYGISTITGLPTDPPTGADFLYGPAGIGHGKIGSIICVGGVLYMWLNDQTSPTNNLTLYKSTNKGALMTITATSVVFPVASAPTMNVLGFTQFGKNNVNAIDGFLYMIAYDQAGGPPFLLRVPAASVETQSAYQIFSGTPSSPAWSTDFTQRQAIAPNESGAAFIYNPNLNLFIKTSGSPFDNSIRFSYSPNHYGPWTEFGNYPLGPFSNQNVNVGTFFYPKWILQNGLEMWIVWSGSNVWDSFNAMRMVMTANQSSTPILTTLFSGTVASPTFNPVFNNSTIVCQAVQRASSW